MTGQTALAAGRIAGLITGTSFIMIRLPEVSVYLNAQLATLETVMTAMFVSNATRHVRLA